MNILHIIAIVLTLICFLVWWDDIGELDKLAPQEYMGRKNFHHWYIGLALQIAMIWFPAWWAFVLVLLGQSMMWDDMYAHSVHVKQCLNGHHPNYKSPWHRAYAATLYKWFGGKVDFK